MKLSIVTATRNRHRSLIEIAASSLINQTSYDFEWVVINDGGDELSRTAINKLQAPFKVVYDEIEHNSEGFGMCYARNRALQIASGEFIAYLDDDNSFEPGYITAFTNLLNTTDTKYATCRQLRRRDVVDEKGTLVKKGDERVIPSHNAIKAASYITDEARFDSNGFAHIKKNAPKWNPHYLLLADYEYFLRCFGRWGEDFSFINNVLVKYFQSSNGSVGSSTAGHALEEFQRLYKNQEEYEALKFYGSSYLSEGIKRYSSMHDQQRHSGFVIE